MTAPRHRPLLVGLAVLLAATVSAAERPPQVILVGAIAVPVFRTRDTRSDVMATAAAGSSLEVLGREGAWYWVMLPPDEHGTRRAGWVVGRDVEQSRNAELRQSSAGSRGGLAAATEVAERRPSSKPATPRLSPGPRDAGGAHAAAGAVTLRPVSSAADAGRAGATPTPPSASSGSGTPPASLPAYPQPPPSVVPADEWQNGPPAWLSVRSLRGSLGAGVESVSVGYDAARAGERGVTGLAGVNATLVIFDPRLLTVNAGADLQQSSVRRSAMRSSGTFRNYRVELATRTGRDSPLNVFANRTTAALDLTPLSPQDAVAGRTRGVRTSRGVSWSLTTRRLPKFEFSALSSRQVDDRDPQLGLNSRNAESSATARALDDTGWVRYDLTYSRRSAAYEVPLAQIGTRTSDDLLNAAVHLTPVRTLTIDASGRGSRYRDNVNGNGRSLDGTGGGAAVRWQFRPRFTAAASYDFSTNLIEALLSGSVAPTVPGIGGPVGRDVYRVRTRFQQADGRVAYVSDRAAIEAVLRDISYGVPAFQPQTLSNLRTLGASVRGQQSALGFDVAAGFDFAVGVARSNRSLSAPYREFGGQASLARLIGQAVALTAEGSLRRASRLLFYPLLLDHRSVGFRVESRSPQWAKARVAVRWSSSLRDGLDTAIRERHASFTFGLSGGRYDLALDLGADQSLWLLLPADVIGSRLEAAILAAARPELYMDLFGGTDQLGTLTATLRPFRGLLVRARALRQLRRFQGQGEWALLGGQLTATYQLRELQIEFGWERLDSNSLLYNTRDLRFYVRVRRDVSLF